MLFNDNLASNVQFHAGKITAIVSLKFYSTDGTEASTATINILIEFFDSNTVVTMTTPNTNNSIGYLSQYMNYNGAILKVVERSV